MATQKKILTRPLTASVKKSAYGSTTETDATATGYVGTLALGKPGDVISRAYGPVVRAYPVTTDTAFGTFVTKKGILVNSNDCAGFSAAVATPFDTETLKAGQTGSFLVSGACVVLKSQVEAIAQEMKVQFLDLADYTAAAATDVVAIEVNGFDNDTVKSSSL